jgi:NADP-dependent 3-hydroxy acid dehydrogenase YdfG
VLLCLKGKRFVIRRGLKRHRTGRRKARDGTRGSGLYCGTRSGKIKAAAAETGGSLASLDMMDERSVESWAKSRDPFDYLVITASNAVHGRFDTLPVADIKRMFDAKFFGPYIVAKACLPKLSDGGPITFFSGVLSGVRV